MSINDRIPQQIKPILEEYISLTDQQLPNLINGFYIVGSIALNEFNERFSDIDFVAVINHELCREEIKRLSQSHQQVEKKYPQWKLSGSYIQQAHLNRGDIEPRPHYHDGTLHLRHSKSDPVTWWILKNHGITLRGIETEDLPLAVHWGLLIAWMKENLNSYWLGWTKRFGRRLVLLSDWGIQWAVLGVLRQYYTFRENAITTKVKAGEYALGCLPSHWYRLIQEAINIRGGKKKSDYPNRILRMMEATNFLKYIIQLCNVEFR